MHDRKRRVSGYSLHCTFLILALAACAAVHGKEPAPPLTLEQIRDFPFASTLVAGQSGSRVAWVVNDRGRRNVWVASGPDFIPRQLTAYAADDGQELTSLAITPDGSHVVHVRGGGHAGNWDRAVPVNPTSHPEGARVEIWCTPFAGGRSQRLAEGDLPEIAPDSRRIVFIRDGAPWIATIGSSDEPRRLFTIRGQTESPKWSPEGRRLAFVSSRGTHSLIGIYQDENTPIRWLAPSFSRDVSPRWSADGKRIAYVRLQGEGGSPAPMLPFPVRPWSIHVADADSGVAREVWRSGEALRDSYDRGFFEWVADDRIVFQSHQHGWPHLHAVPASGGTARALTSGSWAVDNIALSVDRRYLVFSANQGDTAGDHDRRHLYRLDLNGGVLKSLSAGEGLEWNPALTDDHRLLFISATAQRPPLVAIHSPNAPARFLSPQPSAPGYPAQRLLQPRAVSFEADDRVRVFGQLFEPAGRAKRPAILFVHGGPQRQMLLGWHPMEYYTNTYALNQYLASRGFVVLSVNYRLGTDYGHDFQFPAAAGRRGASEYQDIRAAGRFLQALPNVDPQRIGIYGGSYGGYLTAMALAHDSDLFKVGVDIHGVHDWSAHRDFEKARVRTAFETPPDAEEALATAWRASPVSALARWKSPVLFIHGDDDRNVPVRETIDLVQRLRPAGVPVETLMLPDEIHAILRHSNVTTMNAATAEFLERHLKVNPIPIR